MTQGPTSRAGLETVRSILGPIVHLDHSADETPAAHRRLGAEVGDQARAFVLSRILTRPADHFQSELLRARQCAGECQRRLAAGRVPGPVRHALEVYLTSLQAWAEGACLGDLALQSMGDLRIEGGRVTATDLAFLLQAETVGCQTGMLRDRDGGVHLWHTEEDRDWTSGPRFDRLRLFTCKASPEAQSRTMTGFIYPDLLPGPAFGWSGPGYAQAVDAFYLQPGIGAPGVPANAVTWVCLFLGGVIPAAQVAQSLAPIQSGYALSSLTRRADGILAGVTEFVGEFIHTSDLEQAPGAWTFTVNLLSPRAAKAAPGREDLEPEMRGALDARMRRVHRAMSLVTQGAGDWGEALRRLLAFRVGGDFATSNPSVKATFLGCISSGSTSYRVDPGPALRPLADAASVDGGYRLDE